MRTGGLRRTVLRNLCSGDISHPQTHNILRTLYYPPGANATVEGARGEAKILRGGAHNDVALMSVLTPASSGGLEVLARNGTWVEVPPEEDLLYVIAGDTMKLITQGLVSEDGESLEIAPTPHRVTGTIETAARPRTANVLFATLDMTKTFRSPVTGEVIRYRDAAKNIDVALDPGLRLLHARLQANGTLTRSDSFEAFSARAAAMPQRMADLAPGVPDAFFHPPA
jgi:isopenicillin N synthase-like dioxygenase